MHSSTSNLFSNVKKGAEKIFDINLIKNQKEEDELFRTISSFLNTKGGKIIFNDCKKCPSSISMADIPGIIQTLTCLITQNIPHAMKQIKISFQSIKNLTDAYLLILDVENKRGEFFSYQGKYFTWGGAKPYLTDISQLEENMSETDDSTIEENLVSRKKMKKIRCSVCDNWRDIRKSCKICSKRNSRRVTKVARQKLRKLNRPLEKEEKTKEIKRRENLLCASCLVYKVKAYDCFYCSSCYLYKSVKPKTKFAPCHPNIKHYAKGMCRYCYRSFKKKEARNKNINVNNSISTI